MSQDTFGVDVNISGLQFICTCIAYPEQYNVFDEANQQVGYIRLRNGILEVRGDNHKGETLHEWDSEVLEDDEYMPLQADGFFETQACRDYYLKRCASVLLNYSLPTEAVS